MLVEWRPRALRALKTRVDFLKSKNPRAAREAGALLLAASDKLGEFPNLGRPYKAAPGRYRELMVPFGGEGYSLLYKVMSDRVLIMSVKHQREAGY